MKWFKRKKKKCDVYKICEFHNTLVQCRRKRVWELNGISACEQHARMISKLVREKAKNG